MQRLIPRAIVGAIVALILFLVVGGIVLVVHSGMPKPGAESAVIEKAAAVAPTVDLVLGIIILFLAGWWAGKPFAVRRALGCAGLLGLIFIVLNLAIDFSYGGNAGNVWTELVLPCVAKLIAALAGGLLGARRGRAEPMDAVPPEA